MITAEDAHKEPNSAKKGPNIDSSTKERQKNIGKFPGSTSSFSLLIDLRSHLN